MCFVFIGVEFWRVLCGILKEMLLELEEWEIGNKLGGWRVWRKELMCFGMDYGMW